MTNIERPPSKVPAAENTLRILKLLSSKRGPLAASTIATTLELPRSSVYHLLGVMEQSGFIMHLHEEQRYGLGIAAFELSSAYSRQEPLSRLGRPLLAALVDKIGQSAHLAVLHGRDVLYVVEEVTDGLASVAVSVPDHLGWPVAAVAVTFLAEKVPAEQWPDLAERVKKVAGELSGRIYGRRDG